MRTAVLLAAAALTAGCATASESSAAPSTGPSSVSPSVSPSVQPSSAVPPVPDIEAELVRLRTDEAVGGRVQVRITDTGNAPFTVTAVALDSPGFERLGATAVEAAFAPGRTIDLPAPYGAPVCSSPPLPAAAQATVVRPDGTVEDLRLPLAAAVLERIHTEECAALDVLAVVDIEVTGLRDDGDALRGDLVLARRSGGETVTVHRLGRSVLIAAAADELPLELARDAEDASTSVGFTPASCDPHVLSETKKPYVFPLAVTVGDGEEVSLDLPLDDAGRGQLAALVQRVCVQGR
jgi:hypothetical protein